MDKLSKSILRVMHNKNLEKEIICTFPGPFEYFGDFTLNQLAKQVKATENNTKSAVDFLIEEKLAEIVYLSHNKKNSIIVGFRLTHRGNNHRIIRFETLFERFLEGFLLPLMVTIVANIAIALLR